MWKNSLKVFFFLQLTVKAKAKVFVLKVIQQSGSATI